MIKDKEAPQVSPEAQTELSGLELQMQSLLTAHLRKHSGLAEGESGYPGWLHNGANVGSHLGGSFDLA